MEVGRGVSIKRHKILMYLKLQLDPAFSIRVCLTIIKHSNDVLLQDMPLKSRAIQVLTFIRVPAEGISHPAPSIKIKNLAFTYLKVPSSSQTKEQAKYKRRFIMMDQNH